MISRKIKLKRKKVVRYGLPVDLQEDRIADVGSYWNGPETAKGITKEQEERWMPELISLAPKDPGFKSAVATWFKELQILVGYEGLELEIGLDEDGNPINVQDYIKYKIASKHPFAAKNEKECYDQSHLLYYFEDVEAENIAKEAKLEVTSKAYIEFAKLDSDEEKLDWVIRTVLSKYPNLGALSELIKLTPGKKKVKIGEIIQKDPSYFIEIMGDKDLYYKAEIASMVEAGVIMKEGNKYLNGTENLGTLEGAIAWMKDGNNSQEYAILKARLEQFGTPVFKTKVKTK